MSKIKEIIEASKKHEVLKVKAVAEDVLREKVLKKLAEKKKTVAQKMVVGE